MPVTHKEGDRYPLGPPSFSLCNVNLVDGLIWSQEAVGSNPTMETNFKDANSNIYTFDL